MEIAKCKNKCILNFSKMSKGRCSPIAGTNLSLVTSFHEQFMIREDNKSLTRECNFKAATTTKKEKKK